MKLFIVYLFMNILFILISILTYHLFWVQKGKQYPKLNAVVFMSLNLLAIILCMTFATEPYDGYRFDMRPIILTISTLVGGPLAGGIVWFAMIIFRFFFGGFGAYGNIISATILYLFLLFTQKTFRQAKLPKKVLLLTTITLIFSIGWIPFFISSYPGSFNEYLIYLIVYQICSTLGTILSLYLIEVLNSQVKLQEELMNVEKFQVIGEMAASISHEIRNPLTSTRGFLQLLQSNHCSTEERTIYLDIAINGIDQANHVLTDYLTFAKPSIDKIQTLDLHKELTNVLSLITPMTNFANVIIQYSPPSHSLPIHGEKQKLHQCLLNILKNCIEAMPNGGTLTIMIVTYDRMIELVIKDNGIGMTEDQLKRLGSPFYSTKEKGTGLGMMVVFSIMKAMGGSIDITSKLNEGTTFTLQFPKIIK